MGLVRRDACVTLSGSQTSDSTSPRQAADPGLDITGRASLSASLQRWRRATRLILRELPSRAAQGRARPRADRDRKSTRLNSSHVTISYAVFCLKKKEQAGARTVGHRLRGPHRPKRTLSCPDQAPAQGWHHGTTPAPSTTAPRGTPRRYLHDYCA